MTTGYDGGMTPWKVSPILQPAIVEVKTAHPGLTVGTIGNLAHQAEASDHNPDQWGFVCAADFMIGPHFTATNAEDLFNRVTNFIRSGDLRAAFVIYNRSIVSSTVQPGVIRRYLGTDPHTGHVHLSVPHSSVPRPTTFWKLFTQGKDWFDMATQADLENALTNVLAKNKAPFVGRPGERIHAAKWADMTRDQKIDYLCEMIMGKPDGTVTGRLDSLATLVEKIATKVGVEVDTQPPSV